MNNNKDDKEPNTDSGSGSENQNNTVSQDIIIQKYREAARLSGKRKFILIAMTLMWLLFVTFAMIHTITSKPLSPPEEREIRFFTLIPYLNIFTDQEKSGSGSSINLLNSTLMEHYTEKLKISPDNTNLQIKMLILQTIISGKSESSDTSDEFEKYRNNADSKKEIIHILESLYYYKEKPEIDKSAASVLESEINETMTGWVKDYSLYKLYSLSGNEQGKKSIIREAERLVNSMIPGLILFAFLIISSINGCLLLLYFAAVSLWRAWRKTKPDDIRIPDGKKDWFNEFFNFFTLSPENTLEERGIRNEDNLKFISMIFWKAWLSFLAWEFSRNFLSVIVALWYQKYQALPVEGMFLLATAKYAFTVWFVFMIFRISDEKFDLSKIGIQKIPAINRIGELIMGTFGYCCALPLVIGGALVYRTFTGSNPVSQNPAFSFMDKMNSPLQICLLFLLVGIIGPIFEEFLFRGVLYTSLRRHLPAPASIFLISFLFAFIHFDPNVMTGLFILGMVMNILYEKTGSLIPAIVTHCLWNSVTFFLYISLYT